MKNIEINKSIILLIYNKHKDYFIPILVIIVSFLLFILLTIPQIESLLTRQQEVKLERDKLLSLKDSNNILNNLNDSTLNSQLSVASDALPTSKNFSGILNEISISANKTGVFLGDFDFQVGDISNSIAPAKGFPNLELTLSAVGNAQSIAKFIDEFYKSLPLVEVTKIQIGGNHAQLNALFYYRPYNERALDPSIDLTPLTKNDLDTLNQISSWNNSRSFEEIAPLLKPAQASSSASSAF